MELIKADAGGEFCGDSPGIEVSRLRYISSATFVSLFCGSSQINLSHFLTLTEAYNNPIKYTKLWFKLSFAPMVYNNEHV